MWIHCHYLHLTALLKTLSPFCSWSVFSTHQPPSFMIYSTITMYLKSHSAPSENQSFSITVNTWHWLCHRLKKKSTYEIVFCLEQNLKHVSALSLISWKNAFYLSTSNFKNAFTIIILDRNRKCLQNKPLCLVTTANQPCSSQRTK